jgi:hypothetical protein
MSDWKNDLALLRAKKAKDREGGSNRTNRRSLSAGKENVIEGVRPSINTNNEALAIMDPTLALYSDSTPKFKARRSYVASSDGKDNIALTSADHEICELHIAQNSLIGLNGESIVDGPEDGMIGVLRPDIEVEGPEFSNATEKVAVALDFTESSPAPTSPKNNVANIRPNKDSKSPPSTNMSAKYKTPTRIPLPKRVSSGGVAVSPTTQKKESDFAKRLDDYESSEETRIYPNTTGTIKHESSCNDTAQNTQAMRSRTVPDTRYNRSKTLSGRIGEYMDSSSGQQQSKSNEEKPLGDEWKEAQTPGGRRYYYNRRTRKSSWKLPPSAFLVDIDGTQRIFTENLKSRDDCDYTPQRAASSRGQAISQATPPSVDPQQRQRDLQISANMNSNAITNQAIIESNYEMNSQFMSLLSDEGARDTKPPALGQNTAITPFGIHKDTNELDPASPLIYCPFCATPLLLNEERRERAEDVVNSHLVSCRNAPVDVSQQMVNSLTLALNSLKLITSIEHQHGQTSRYSDSLNNTAELSTTAIDTTAEPVEICEDCGRKFSVGRLASHAKACKSVFQEKRTPYDGRRKRLMGTPMEFITARDIDATPTPTRNRNAPRSGVKSHQKISPLVKTGIKKEENALNCPYCDHGTTSRDALMKHLRECVTDSKLREHVKKSEVFGGHAEARSACPFCAKPTSTLSAHLIQCDRRKILQNKRTQAGVPNLYNNTAPVSLS